MRRDLRILARRVGENQNGLLSSRTGADPRSRFSISVRRSEYGGNRRRFESVVCPRHGKLQRHIRRQCHLELFPEQFIGNAADLFAYYTGAADRRSSFSVGYVVGLRKYVVGKRRPACLIVLSRQCHKYRSAECRSHRNLPTHLVGEVHGFAQGVRLSNSDGTDNLRRLRFRSVCVHRRDPLGQKDEELGLSCRQHTDSREQ